MKNLYYIEYLGDNVGGSVIAESFADAERDSTEKLPTLIIDKIEIVERDLS